MEELIADLVARARSLTQTQTRVQTEDQISARLLRAAADRVDPLLRATAPERLAPLQPPVPSRPPFMPPELLLQDGSPGPVSPRDPSVLRPGPNGWWRPEYDPDPFDTDQRVYLPASTPVHPKAPLMLTPSKFGPFELPIFVNGWCAVGWIVRTAKGGGGSSFAAGTEKAKTLLSTPSQQALDKITAEMTKANTILYGACGIALRLCSVYELDARRLFVNGARATVSLADTFTDGKLIPRSKPLADRDNKPKTFLGFVDDLINFRGSIQGTAAAEQVGGVARSESAVFAEFTKRFQRPCVHLFFVDNVEKQDDPDTENKATRGVTGQVDVDTKKEGKPVPNAICVVESDDEIASTIAHEIGHGLGLPHAEDHPAEDMKAATDGPEKGIKGGSDNLMRATPTGSKLRKSQCDRMLAYLRKNVAVACP